MRNGGHNWQMRQLVDFKFLTLFINRISSHHQISSEQFRLGVEMKFDNLTSLFSSFAGGKLNDSELFSHMRKSITGKVFQHLPDG